MLPTLLLTAAVTIVLGMGMPTPSAYILGAALMTPILTKLGIFTMGAHMFVLYYAVMSALTPPVAVAAYAASSIAEDNPLYIALLAVKFALAAFIIPFAFIFGPELLMNGAPLEILFSLGTAISGLIFIAAAVEGYLTEPLSITTRLIMAAGGLALVAPDTLAAGIGTVLVSITLGPAIYRKFISRSSDLS